MNSFFNSAHCKSKAHCWTCRNVEDGRTWRMSIASAFNDVAEEMFECPSGLAWNSTPARPNRENEFEVLVKKIAALSMETIAHRWLKHMAAQCQELARRSFPTCGQRRKHRKHQLEKLKYFWNEAITE